MTQAYNLAILANAVDTSGRLNVGTNATGTLPIANGGTGTTTPSLVQGTGVTITGSWPNQTINATGTGTVTSVATGNGLQGGTITTTGTLSIAAPSYNTVGSYAMITMNASGTQPNTNTTYSAGSGSLQMQAGAVGWDGSAISFRLTNNLSGTWRWMSATNGNTAINQIVGLGCRVS